MTEKYTDLTEEIWRADEGRTSLGSVNMVLDYLDRHPDQVPGRTITESESKGLFAAARSGIDFWPPALEFTGITVVPDPEPTNAEKLKAVLDAIGDSTDGYREHLASKLDEAGVKAPGGGE